MFSKQAPLDPSAPEVPIRRLPWFVQMMMIFAVVSLAGIVYGFWQIAQTESAPAAPAATDAEQPEQPQPVR